MAIGDNVIGDDPIGAAQPAPPSSERNWPYLIQAGAKLKIAKVQVSLVGLITGTGPQIRGFQADGFDVPETTLSQVSGDIYEANNIEIPAAFTASRTDFFNTFDMDWEVSLDGSTWEYAGTSFNPIYVCLANPNTSPVSGITVFRTLVHLACSNSGATDANSSVANTWALFSSGGGTPGPTNVDTWDGRHLYYYRQGTTFAFSDNPITVSGLLKVGTGECVAWAHMLQDAWAINGASSSYNVATSHAGGFFWVKTWSNLGSLFYFQSTEQDMKPWPASDTQPYGYYDNPPGTAFKNETSVPGQNSANSGWPGAPGEKVFGNHQFLKYGGVYYDPSYGLMYSSNTDFATKAIAGYGNFDANVSGKRRMTFSTSGSIDFSV